MKSSVTGLPAEAGRNSPCWCGSGKKAKYCHASPSAMAGSGPVRAWRQVPEGIERPPYIREPARPIGEPARPIGHPARPMIEPAQPTELASGAASAPSPLGTSPAGSGYVRGASRDDRAGSRYERGDRAERLRRTGRLAADIARAGALAVKPGVTTDEIDELCHTMAIEAGAYPSPLGYSPGGVPFPKSICTSINEVICHGIPDSRPLREGDIVSIDVTVYREGVHGDTCVTLGVGEVDPLSQRLIEVTRQALDAAIAVVAPGAPLNAIGRAIQARAEPEGFGVVRDFVGHGVGEEFHGSPQVPHFYSEHLYGTVRPGMSFTIEPMITAGSYEVAMWPDGWTAMTADRSRCAQFEHSLLVTDDGVEILTVPSQKQGHPYWASEETIGA